MVLSSAPIYSGCGLAQISPEASNDLLSTHGWKTFFRTSSKNSDEATAGVAWIRKNWPQIKTVATVDFNDSGTTDQGRAFAAEWTKAGGTVVDQAHMTAGAGDYRGAITGVIAKQPQLIIVCAFDTDGGLLVKQIRELGYKGGLFGADGVSTPNFIKVAGAGNAEGFHLTNFGYEPGKIPSAAKFSAAYKKAYGEAPSAAAANAYDATMVLIHAWKAAGSSDRKKVVAGVTHNDYQGLYGPVTFTAGGDLATPQIGIYGVKAGDFEFVAKAD
jgi:branched-chain amino acid transport system substrate-binding protein